MEKDIFEMIRQDYINMKNIANGDYSEIAELEKNPIVQRYLYLLSLKQSRDLLENGERCIVGKLIDKYGHGAIKESNNIWCLLFESTAKNIKGIPIIYSDDLDINEGIVVYRDIEDSSKMIAISKGKQEEFESTHNVVFGNPEILDYSDRYYNIRRLFFNDCIVEGQETAVKKILPVKRDLR